MTSAVQLQDRWCLASPTHVWCCSWTGPERLTRETRTWRRVDAGGRECSVDKPAELQLQSAVTSAQNGENHLPAEPASPSKTLPERQTTCAWVSSHTCQAQGKQGEAWKSSTPTNSRRKPSHAAPRPKTHPSLPRHQRATRVSPRKLLGI